MHRLPSRPRFLPAVAATAAAFAAAWAAPASGANCQAVSGAQVPTVVELYTSEGCSSCPPADHWLSTLKGRTDVIALAFHVDYWDGLGWKDRFAQAQFTQRQSAEMHTDGAHFAYTPQVIIDGRDSPHWNMLQPATLAAKPRPGVTLRLEEDATALALTVTPESNAATALAGYLAVVDDGLQTQVAGGENRGATLHHDGVVRALVPWSTTGTQTLRFTPSSAGLEPGTSRHWVAVALDDTGRPLQALSLGCAR